MRSHHNINNKQVINIVSLLDIRQMAMMQGKQVTEGNNTFNGKKVFKIQGEEGLFTFDELKNRFLH